MAVSIEYLDKVGFATIRREPGQEEPEDQAMDDLIIQYIENCRADLIRVGVPEEIANDEENASVLGCVNSFVRWKLSFTNSDSVPNRDEYRIQADELRKSING